MAREFTVVIERDEEGFYVADTLRSCMAVTPKRDRSIHLWRGYGRPSNSALRPAARAHLPGSSSGYKE